MDCYRYICLKERFAHSDIGKYTSYGVEVVNEDGIVVNKISDISSNRKLIEKLTTLLNQLGIPPFQLLTYVEAFTENDYDLYLIEKLCAVN